MAPLKSRWCGSSAGYDSSAGLVILNPTGFSRVFWVSSAKSRSRPSSHEDLAEVIRSRGRQPDQPAADRTGVGLCRVGNRRGAGRVMSRSGVGGMGGVARAALLGRVLGRRMLGRRVLGRRVPTAGWLDRRVLDRGAYAVVGRVCGE